MPATGGVGAASAGYSDRRLACDQHRLDEPLRLDGVELSLRLVQRHAVQPGQQLAAHLKDRKSVV